MALITCSNLAPGYDGIPVVKGLNFTVSEGDFLSIIGENGAGKSTLVKTLLNLIKPVSGTIETGDGLDRREIGYLPQQTAIQKDFPATVWEIVLSGTLAKCGLRPFYGKKEKETAEYNLERMGISNLRNMCYRKLSGGQQQRVLLARALSATSRLLLLDEPVTGLDPEAAAGLYGVIKKLASENVAIIMVSHDIGAAVRYSDHILYISHEKPFFGTKEEFMKTGKWAMYMAESVDEDGNI